MYRRVAQRLTQRTAIVFTIGIALLPQQGVSLLISGVAQGQREERRAKPKPGKPEGELPDLEEVKQESGREREAQPPIPSTVRSKKNPLQPWDGRRVGDPGTHGGLGHNGTERGSTASNLAADSKPVTERPRNQTRRAHARAGMVPPPPVPESQFVQTFFTYALVRNLFSNETTYWHDQLRKAHANGQTALQLAAIELGRTLFESAEYAARNRDNHWYVYDLYKTYLMRDPDSGGWAFWEGQVPANGREAVRRSFEESGEFATLIANLTLSGSPTSAAASLVSARVDPRNQPGHGMLTRDASWSVPLLGLPGRNGLDLGLGLSYSSMVWTRSGPYLYFDEDNGFPSPGFRLGFPTVQRKVFDAQTAKNAYLMLTASGRRVELRHVGANIYEAFDSSYLRLTEDGATLRVHSTDGTRLSFTETNGEYRCIEVKDRNGNYLTINYNALGRITTITDTLGRVITFNYDGNANLLSITQAWNGQPSHQWVSFGWGTRTMQSSFSDSTLRGVIGTTNGTLLPVITQVNLNDTSHFTFDYTNSLQVSAIRNYFGALERNTTIFTYETPAGDAPRLIDSRVSARNWTGINGVPSQVVTTYSVAGDGACVLTAPDGTIYKEYYGAGWQRGLTTVSEVWSGGQKKKWTTRTWAQDTADSFEVNPRVIETNVYDAEGNRRRTTFDYYPISDFSLLKNVYEYAANASTLLRRTYREYNLHQAYRDRRIIGLVFAHHVYDGSNNLVSKFQNSYDFDGPWLVNQAGATQHDDANYPSTFVLGRGNLVETVQYNVQFPTDPGHARAVQRQGYNSLGSIIFSADANWHRSDISYTDAFSDSINRNTFAYPTTFTDPDNFNTTVQYNFDFGATTRTQLPAPAGQSQGAIQTMTYNSLGQLERVTTTNNGAYKRFWYGADFTASYATVNNLNDELYSIQVTDGSGRVIGAAANHPGSSGGYRLVNTIYNLMGHAWKNSNPTEVNSSWAPSGDDAAGMYYTQQSYDWEGRPRVTTNPDGTTKEAGYAGCGCAGGSVVTLTDEGTVDGGVAKRRQQKIYSDVLGRTVKTEILNWQNGTVYSAAVSTYNARDQVTQIREYAGAEGSATFQDTTMTYDGHGRLKTRHVPAQSPGTNSVWDYNADDTIHKITDARGASQTFAYNNRHLTTNITYAAPGGSGIAVPAATSFAYDAAGNRTSMTDAVGSTSYTYDQLSRLTSEGRTFTGVGTFSITYGFNLANQLISLAEPTQFGSTFSYGYDLAGRLTSVNGSAFAGVTNYASNAQYRAWGGLKHLNYGNSRALDVTYNARLQAASFTIPGVISKTYNYYADGALRFSSDLTNHKWDRFYSYDHAARIKEAFSGAEARFEPQTNNRPYRQTFGYDQFNHVTARLSLNWSTNYSTSNSYTNNRRDSWLYDAEGNLLAGAEINYSYDAGGRIRTVETLEPFGDTTRSLDGDGQQVKTEHVTLDEQTGSPVTTIRYYLRSSVLKGQVLTEIESTGVKSRTFVYAGSGGVLAWHVYYGVNPGVVWEHWDSSQASFRTSDIVGQSVGHSPEEDPAELDPDGANAGLHQPLIEPVEPNEGNGSLMPSPAMSDPARPDVKYSVDGIPVAADYFRVQVDFAFQSNLGVLDPIFIGYSVRYGDREIFYGLDELTATSAALEFGNNTLIRNWLVNDTFWGFSRAHQPSTEIPQNHRVESDDLKAYRARIEEMLKNKACADYIQQLLNEVKTQTGMAFGDILTTFDAMRFYWANTGGAHGGYAYWEEMGTVRAADIMNTINTERMGGSRANQMDRRAFLISETTQAFVGETMHHLSQGGRMYSDAQMANALNAVLVRQGLDTHRDFPDKTTTDVENASRYWHPKVQSACPAPRK